MGEARALEERYTYGDYKSWDDLCPKLLGITMIHSTHSKEVRICRKLSLCGI